MKKNAQAPSIPDREGLLAASDAVREGLMACDVEALKGLYAEDFRAHNIRGEVETRDLALEMFRPDGVRIDIFEVEDLAAEVIGDVGILTGLGSVSGSFGNTAFRHRVRFVDIYLWRDGCWRYHFSQMTELAPGDSPPGRD